MTQTFSHIPVLFDEALSCLGLQEGEHAVDVTAGGGGHFRAMAQAVGEAGCVIALDRDARAHGDDRTRRLDRARRDHPARRNRGQRGGDRRGCRGFEECRPLHDCRRRSRPQKMGVIAGVTTLRGHSSSRRRQTSDARRHSLGPRRPGR